MDAAVSREAEAYRIMESPPSSAVVTATKRHRVSAVVAQSATPAETAAYPVTSGVTRATPMGTTAATTHTATVDAGTSAAHGSSHTLATAAHMTAMAGSTVHTHGRTAAPRFAPMVRSLR